MESALAPLLGIGLSRGHGSVLAARAAFAEAGGDLEQALELYREAEERWIELGHRPERAHALLGEGRTLAALGRSIEARAKVEAASGIVAVLVRFG